MMDRRNKRGGRVLLGAHFSIAGGLHRALETASQYGCPVLQLFTKNASTWKERQLSAEEIRQFERAGRQGNIEVVCSHAAYLINLASPDRVQYERSVKALGNELRRSSQLAIPYVVLHPGAHMGRGGDHGLRQVAKGIDAAFEQVPEGGCHLLLETTAGQGTNLGRTFEQLAAIADRVEAKGRLGFCFDTCHVFAAGYDLRTKKAYDLTMSAFDRVLGLERLHIIHVNDAKKGLGSRVDRHEHIGQGAIGIEAFGFIMNDSRLRSMAKILETPKGNGVDHDRLNLERLRALVVDGDV
ncbi:MAG: deoxyribonuclease IV [Thermodesulfobacteriota bacterium]|nr:deoxyribonuclease IV [Thermodesulfobacteriota bacterium]